jgi:2,3-dihydroxyphenylpropionate 1,2-dioxygenase
MSHSPARELVRPQPDIEARARAALDKARRTVLDFDPDLVVIFGPDHFNHYSYESMPAFSIALSARSTGDYGSVPTDADIPWETARALAAAVLDDGVDVAVAEHVSLDHAYSQPVTTIFDAFDSRPIIPVFLNCFGFPLAPVRRARQLGEAIGRYLSELDGRVLIFGSGGLSHQLPPFFDPATQPPENFHRKKHMTEADYAAKNEWMTGFAQRIGDGSGELGPPNPEWDRNVLGLLADGDLEQVDTLTTDAIGHDAGLGGQEIRTWVAAHAALSAVGPYETSFHYYEPIPHWLCGFGVAFAEPRAS